MKDKDDESFSVRAKAHGDLVVTEKCPLCGQVHKWIWPKHPELGEKGTKKCGGKEIIVKLIPESEYKKPEEYKIGEVEKLLLKKSREGDIKAKKALKRINRLNGEN